MSARAASRRVAPAGWSRDAGARPQQIARRHRESDHRRLRSMAAALMAAGVLVALGLGMVGLRVQQVRLSYRLDALRTARAELDEANRRLRVELATLRALSRIEGKARTELGMVAPGRDQVRLAREFVPGGHGGGVVERRSIVAERAVPRDTGIR